MCFLYGDLKSRQVDFPQGSLVDNGVDNHAMAFLIIRGIVFEAGPHALALNTLNPGSSHLPRQVRIFGKVLEIAPTQWAALDVNAGAQQHTDLLGYAGLAKCLTHFCQQIPVPAACQTNCRGETDGRHTVAEANVVAVPLLLSQAVGAVSQPDRGEIESLYPLQFPECSAGAQGRFLDAA